jgi:hypothetical protein
MKKLFLIALWTARAFAQSGHSTVLTWADGVNPSGTTTYNVYRTASQTSGFVCPASGSAPSTVLPTTPVFTLIGNTQALTITDSSVTAGNTYCFLVSALITGGTESLGNPIIGTTVPNASAPPTNLKAVTK